jgi:hypothetical protein
VSFLARLVCGAPKARGRMPLAGRAGGSTSPSDASRFRSWSSSALLALLALVGASLLFAPTAGANTPIEYYSVLPSARQAGGHPDVEIDYAVKNRVLQASENPCDCEDAKDATVHFPAGFIGNPHATPQCSNAEFAIDSCPVDSQIGIVSIGVTSETGGDFNFDSAVYNLVPPPNVSGLSAFRIFLVGAPQFLVLSARTGGDYGLNATGVSLFHGAQPLHIYREDLWGVPAEHSHDLLRIDKADTGSGETAFLGNLCDATGARSTTDPSTIYQTCETDFKSFPPIPSNSPLTPFLQNPTTCESSLSSSLEVLSYDGGVTSQEDVWPTMTGCDQLSFDPSLYAEPTTSATDTPSGIDVDLSIPQLLSPTVPSPTELRSTTVTLPPGFSINAGAADGKTACTDAEAHLGAFASEEEAQCPEDSKVGSLTIDSAALPGPLPGFVYLGQPLPGDRYRIFLVANGFAFHIKLAGIVTPDPVTGQLSISFQNLPQSPLTAFDLHFFGSERGLLATPSQCGTYPVTTTFTPWDETIGTQTSTQFFTLDSGPSGTACPGSQRPFHPGFEASSAGNTAGAHTSFSVQVTRSDGDQNLSALNVTTPPGFSATLAGIPYCSDAALASAASSSYSGLQEEANPSCPVASQIGTAVTGAGAGTHPLYVSGKVYLAGPYKDASLSLAVITPAVSGPYDLGNVVVRVALHVNPETAQITAISDPLPQILEGIPLRLREIRIELNRPNFTLNPTNCNPFSVNAEVFGIQGAVASPSDTYQVANCRSLPFDPKLALSISGATKRAGNPALNASLTAASGEANIASTAVTLPSSEIIDNAHIKNPCTKVEFAAAKCPASSIIGAAKATTPLLEKPLEGPVYLRSAPENKSGLPDIVAALDGQIDIDLDGKIETVKGRLRTSFKTVPDAPVSRFNLSLDGGKKGLLVNSVELCQAPLSTLVQIGGQNGAIDSQNQRLATPCGGSQPAKRHLQRARVVG